VYDATISRGISARRRSAVRRRRRAAWFLLKFAIYSLLIVVAAMAGVVWGTYNSIAGLLPKPEEISTLHPFEGTRILSADGVQLATITHQYREYAPIESIPVLLQQAAIAVEDKRFYSHPGVDFRGTLRAAYRNLRGHRVTEGGSTITQQLARSIYLSPRRTVGRKLQEIFLALQIERKFSKKEILELYLSQVYFGNGAYGVQSAAKTYFGKSLDELTASECAFIAGMPRRPSAYDPFAPAGASKEEREQRLKRALARRDQVLNEMYRQGRLDDDSYQQALAEAPRFERHAPSLRMGDQRAPYFTTWVLRQLVDDYGEDVVYKGGLVVRTSLNWQLQQIAEKVVAEHVKRARGLRVGDGSLVALDPTTGEVLAMVGGTDFDKDQFNIATQAATRQPGSAFKVFVYTAAIASGKFTPDSRISDSYVAYTGADGKRWAPHNYDNKFRGRVTLRRALAMSINVVAVKLADQVGIDKVITYARSMGLEKGRLEPYLPTAIGAGGATPLEMASAYGVLANRGGRVAPTGIVRVADVDGNLWMRHIPRSRQVVDVDTADTMTDMLRDVVTAGTAARALGGFRGWFGRTYPGARGASGKTGTASDHRDAWFCGYVVDPMPVSCAVWVGNRDNSPMHRVAGSTVPAPMWGDFMQQALPILVKLGKSEQASGPASSATTPSSRPRMYRVKLCAESNLRATKYCPHTIWVEYRVGERPGPPRETCLLHRAPPSDEENPTPENGVVLTICRDSGMLATENCPHVVTRVFAPDKAPTETCPIHGHPPDEGTPSER
jgi:penicillin-binding protein 1A